MMWSTLSSAKCGKSQRTTGPMILDERCEDCWSLDAVKISAAQSRMGSQYLTNARSFDTTHSKPEKSAKRQFQSSWEARNLL